MPSSSENKDLVENVWTQAYNEGNMDIVDKAISEDIIVHDVGLRDPIEGRETLKEYIQMLRSAFPDLQATTVSMVAEDDIVAGHFQFEGTHEGDFLGIEATDQRVTGMGMEFDRVEDGHILEAWSVWDTLGFLEQVGAIDIENLPFSGSA